MHSRPCCSHAVHLQLSWSGRNQWASVHCRPISTLAFTHVFIHAFVHPCIRPEVWVGDDTERVKSCQTQLGLQDSRDGFHGPQVLSSPGSPVLELRPAYWTNSTRGKCTRLRQLAKSCLCFYWAHFSKV